MPPAPCSPRRGINLTEVLIAMGILTIGLLGVASVFPVGSHYMQQGEVADRASAIAQAAFNDALVRGTLNPENWITWEDGAIRAATGTLPLLAGVQRNKFNRPLAQMMRAQQASFINANKAPIDLLRQSTQEFGSVFVIDPLGIASIATMDPTKTAHVFSGTLLPRSGPGAVFPCANYGDNGIPNTPGYGDPWYPWVDAASPSVGPRWPVRRVTLREAQPTTSPAAASPPGYQPMRPSTAQKLFSSHDDLSLDLPTAQDKPAIQRWRLANLNGTPGANEPLARQSLGHYSWIFTIAPTTSEGRDALATDPSRHVYEVSTVVFHRRPISSVSPTDDAEELNPNMDVLRRNERGTRAQIVSTGLNGGEVLLTRFPASAPSPTAPEPEESPFNNLKVGNWIMLCGPHPNSTDERPMIVSRWYRVLAIEGKNERLDQWGNPTTNTSEPERRLVSLRGPQWPWQPVTGAGYADAVSNQLYVCIPTGAVAVHSKKIRLEGNSIYNGGATGLTSR